MNKLSLVALFTALAGIGTAAHAVTEPTCYVPVHGLFSDGSVNSIDFPVMTVSSNSYVEVHAKNISNKPLNIKAYFYDWDGARVTPENPEISDDFEMPYTPLSPDTTSGILFPGNVGTFKFNTSATQRVTGKLRWQADACLDSAVEVTVRNSFWNLGIMTEGNLMVLNGGNAF